MTDLTRIGSIDLDTASFKIPIIGKGAVAAAKALSDIKWTFTVADGPVTLQPSEIRDAALDDFARSVAARGPEHLRQEFRRLLGFNRDVCEGARQLADEFLRIAEISVSNYPAMGFDQPEVADGYLEIGRNKELSAGATAENCAGSDPIGNEASGTSAPKA